MVIANLSLLQHRAGEDVGRLTLPADTADNASGAGLQSYQIRVYYCIHPKLLQRCNESRPKRLKNCWQLNTNDLSQGKDVDGEGVNAS